VAPVAGWVHGAYPWGVESSEAPGRHRIASRTECAQLPAGEVPEDVRHGAGL